MACTNRHFSETGSLPAYSPSSPLSGILAVFGGIVNVKSSALNEQTAQEMLDLTEDFFNESKKYINPHYFDSF
jgi:hypothetical protein